ncbi:CPBP family intramembrane metalloprotease [Chryseobacterium suipulveris]|uniref:CPBP family intramembrane metalloprotease n=1 Tax=Chryseobacterium suipulveris TaxID=2929800 RepID=A0ABY4BMW0_9FLAO|nr:type II CAAX endopeptidase family protein [Chryseobacterium suipulveris]UOE40109.1 CPBP family intramembrane metalloprotease [Chryseobacterium suipulveris]
MPEVSPNKKFIFDWKGAMALIGGMIVGSVIVATFNVFAMFVFKENFQYQDLYLMIANAAGFLGAIFAFDYFVYRPQTGRKLNFNLSSTNFVTYLLIFPMMLGMMFIAEFITSQIPVTGSFFGPYYDFFSRMMEQMTKDKATMIVLAVIMAPVFEEIVFRGIIQKGLINKGMKPMSAILISSVVFGIVHGNPWQFVGAVFLGCVLGLVYYKTKSLLMPILLHAFNNLCSSILIFYGNTESFSETFHISQYAILAIGIVLFSFFCYLFMKKYRVHYSES